MATSKLIIVARDRDQSAEMKAALDAFMRHLWSSTQQSPIGHGRIFRGALIECLPSGHHIWLKTVWAIERRRGWGTQAMKFICYLADTYKVPVTLSPQRFGIRGEGMTTAQLKRWYRRYGFVSREGGDMLREPKGGQA